jgi:hypothetical protein
LPEGGEKKRERERKESKFYSKNRPTASLEKTEHMCEEMQVRYMLKQLGV